LKEKIYHLIEFLFPHAGDEEGIDLEKEVGYQYSQRKTLIIVLIGILILIGIAILK